MGMLRLMEYEWSDVPREVDYYIPDSWDTTLYEIAGAHRPPLGAAEVKAKIDAPIGSATIRDLAKGKQKVCILFDDMSRGTPTWKVAPLVIEELHAGGIPDSAIEFICATGAHEPWDRAALVKKVGSEIMEKYSVYNHVSFLNCEPLGQTSYGTRVEISREVLSCDLKISICDISPHPSYGFSGGGKMIMPGVSSYESIAEHHGVTHRRSGPPGAPSPTFRSAENELLKDAIEFARMAKLDFSIHCVLNHKADIVDIFAGDVEASQKAGIDHAKEHFSVPESTDNDIAIANAFCKANEANFAMSVAFRSLKRSGGTAVVIANSQLGQIGHYLFGSWGKDFGGRIWHRMSPPDWVRQLVFYSEFPEGRNRERFAEKDLNRIYFPSQWAEVIGRLVEWHGTRAKVAVFPDGTNQL